jgi:hypothetical protein
MKRFDPDDRDRSMDNTVSFHNVPTFRGIAFCVYHVEKKGGKVTIFSADRRDTVIAEHNSLFGTSLHGQGYLYRNQDRSGFNPANPPNRTSHCLYADAVIAQLLTKNGRKTVLGGQIPWWALPLDLADYGKSEDVSRFLRLANLHGYKFVQPYTSGSEQHHVMLVKNPIAQLEKNSIISQERHA